MSEPPIGAVRTAWREAAAGAPGPRTWRAVRTGCPGPLTILAAIRESDGGLAVLFEATIESAPDARCRFEADGISMIEERNYPERTYRMAVTLERPDLENIYAIVIADLIEGAAAQATPSKAFTSLFSRLTAWQAFLRARHMGLGREAVVGLIGELLVLRRLASSAGWAIAIDAWKGPFGGLHDFARKGQAVEVKTSAGVASLIEIPLLDQLEDAGLTNLILVHVQLAEAASGISLPGLFEAIADAIRQCAPEEQRAFTNALLAAGYADVDAELYRGQTYQPIGSRFYRVSPGFPRLTRSGVPQGVTEASYRLDFRAIQPHLMEDGAADQVLREMGQP